MEIVMEAMDLLFLCKDEGSGGGGCDSVYLRSDGKAVIQAQEADGGTFARLRNVLPGERAVCLDPDIICRAADMIRSRRTS
jgi:hypothetical protein